MKRFCCIGNRNVVMRQMDFQMRWMIQGCIKLSIWMVVVSFLACAQSHKKPNNIVDDSDASEIGDSTNQSGSGINDTLFEHDSEGWIDGGLNGSEDATSDADRVDFSDSSNVETDSRPAEPPGTHTIDDWQNLFPEDTIDVDENEQPPLGLWIGETKEAIACSTSKRVVIEIIPSGTSGSAVGFVTFGETEPPPPETDPERYPSIDSVEAFDCRTTSPIEGFRYTLLEGQLSESGRFQFRIAVLEELQTWCSLQTSYFDEIRGEYKCIPWLSGQEHQACEELSCLDCPASSVECPYDYGKYEICNRGSIYSICICEQDGCTVNMNKTFRFDLVADETTMEGVIANLTPGFVSSPTEVRLKKVEE